MIVMRNFVDIKPRLNVLKYNQKHNNASNLLIAVVHCINYKKGCFQFDTNIAVKVQFFGDSFAKN